MSLNAEQLARINAARKTREAMVMATFLKTGETLVLPAGNLGAVSDALKAECEKRLLSGKPGMVKIENDVEVFLNVYVPAPRLIIIGAVHISQALADMAKIAGLEVTIIDPRSAFATKDRFENHNLYADWPDDILPKVGLDAYTALAAITHDPKIDDFPLIQALENKCFYVGALGSRKTHARRFERLSEAGVSDEAFARINAPIGLNIGAASPQEIAVAILAQVILALRGAKPEKKSPAS